VSYFENSGLSTIALHGPRSVKMGAGWKKFCALHELSADDHREVVFEGESEKTSINIKVLYPLNYF